MEATLDISADLDELTAFAVFIVGLGCITAISVIYEKHANYNALYELPRSLLSLIATVQAAELQILAGGAMAGPVREIAPAFERASGHTLVLRFGTCCGSH